MSYFMYNSFAPGKENASQGQYGLFSGQMERNHWRTTPNLGPEYSFRFPGTSPGAHETSKEINVEQYSLPGNHRLENHLSTLDNKSQSTFNIPPREEIGHQHSSTSSGSSSFNWLPDHKTTTEDFMKSTSNVFVCGTPAVDRRLSSEPSHSRRNPQLAENILKIYELERADLDELLSYSEEQTTAEKLPYLLQNIRMKKAERAASAFQSNSSFTYQPTASASGRDAGVGFGQEGVLQDKMSSTLQLIKVTKSEPTAACSAGIDAMIGRNIQSAAVSCRNTFLADSFQSSSQSKDGLLESFSKVESVGLGSSDDQMGSFDIVPPPILDHTRQLQTQPNQTLTLRMTPSIGFGQTGIPQDQKQKITIQPIKMIDYAHTAKCVAGVESVKNICNTTTIGGQTLLKDGSRSSTQSKEASQLRLAEIKSSSLVSSDDQMASVAHLNSLRNFVAQPSSNPAEKLETQQNHTSQSVSPLPLQHKNRDATSNVECKTQGQGSNIADPLKSQQKLQKINIHSILQILQDSHPAVSFPAKSVSPSFILKMPDVSDAVLPSAVVSCDPVSSVSQSLPIIKTENPAHLPSSKPQSPAEPGPSQDLPSLTIMHDYSAVMPRTFSHICSLCKKECAQLTDWVVHQSTTLHQANCKRLRSQYSHWDGVVPSSQRDASRSAKTLPPTSLYRHQKNKCDSRSHSRSSSPSCSSSGVRGDKSNGRSRSRSYSPRHHRSSRDGKERSSSSSCSHSRHHSSRDGKYKSTSNVHLYTPRRSRSRHRRNRSSYSSSARSQSPSHHRSRDRRNRSNSSSCQRRLQRCISSSRSCSRSPNYDRTALSCHRARSGSSEKQSSPKRMCKKSFSPRRNHERQLSRGRSPERRLSPRRDRKHWSKRCLEQHLSPKRNNDKQWSPKRSLRRESSPRKTDDDKQLSPIRIRIRQLSPRKIDDKRWSPTSGWKKRISPRRTGDEQWSPKRSLERESFPRKTDDDKQLSPIRIRIRQLSPRKIDDKGWSPTSGWKKQLSSRRTDNKRGSPTRSHEQQSPTRSDNWRLSPMMSYDQQPSPIRAYPKRCSPTRNRERQSSPRVTDGKSRSPMRVRVRQSSPKNTDDKRCSPPRRTDERRRSPTRSLERQSSPRKNCDKRWSPTSKCKRQSPPKHANVKQWSPTKTHERRSSPRNADDKWWSPPRRTDNRQWSPSRSHERQSSPRKNDDKRWSPTTKHERRSPPKDANLKQWSPTKIHEQRSSPRNTDDKLWSPLRTHEHQSSPDRTIYKRRSPAQSSEHRRKTDDKQWLPQKSHRQQSFPGRDEKHFVPKQSDEEMSSIKKNRKRHAFLEEELSSKKKKSCSIQMLTKKLLKKSAVQSASRQSNIESVVNLVVPVLLSELAKNQDSSSPSLVLPSQAKNQKVLRLSSSGCKSSSSLQPKLEWNQARSSKKCKDSTSKRALSIITEDWRKLHKLKARVGNESGSCEKLDLLPIKTLLSLQKKLVSKAKKLSSKGKHIYSSKAHSLKTKTLKSIALNKQRLQPKSRRLETGCSNQRRESIVSRKDQDFKEKTRVKSITKITVAESNKGKKTVTDVKADGSRTSADKPLDKTAKCSGVAKQIRVEKSPGDKWKSVKPSQKVQPRMVPNPDSKKDNSFGKNPDSSSTMGKLAANPMKKDKDSEVAVKDTTKVGKMLQRAVAEANEGKEMVTKVRVSASKTSADKKLNKTAKCSGVATQKKVKESLGDTFSNPSPNQPKETKPLLGKVVTTLDPPQAQEILKPQETSVKAFLKVQPRMVPNPDSKKYNSFGKNPDSSSTMRKLAANPLKKDKEVAVKDTTKVGKMLQRTVAEANKGKEIVTKVKVKASKTSADTKPSETKTFVINTKKSQPKSKATATNASLSKPEHPQPVSKVVTTPDKVTAQTRTRQTTTETPETLVQQKVVSNPNLAALNPKTNGKQLQVQPQSAGSSAHAPLGPVQNTEQEEGKTYQKDAALSETQKNQLQKPVGSGPAADSAITSSDIKTAATPNHVKDLLTVGESMAYYLNPTVFDCVSAERVLSSKPFSPDSKLLLITNLPVKEDCCYTEEELVDLLCRFEFQYAHNNIFVIPQTGMAFVLMPNKLSVIGLLWASMNGHLTFKQHKLRLHIVKKHMVMTPNMKDDGTSIIYIQNISPSDTIKLREVLRSIGSIRNFLPLLNKVFVEFETVYDADRLGVWYSLMRRGFLHTVLRLKVPRSRNKSQPPKLPLKALPDSEERLSKAEIPNGKHFIPQSTTPPFWITMITAPFVFPTVCPWFNVPHFLTVRGEKHVLTPPPSASKFSTIMLTGLPEGTYKHEDVAKLVWRYFPKQNLETLYYNILVLPLQRRAFVFFCDWEACCRFVSDCVRNPVSVNDCPLSVHFVFDDMHPGSSEENMFRTLMKWSNGYVPELFLLDKRLLCVETYEMNVNLIKRVMKEVANIASFVSILPLTNRICIEMASPSGVAKVLQEMPLRNDLSPYVWSKVGRIECVKDLNQRLKETREIKVNLEVETPEVSAEPPALKTRANVVLSEARNDGAQSTAAVPAAFIEPTICASESKPEDLVAEPPDVVLDSKARTASTTHESQPCEKTSVVADPDNKTQTDPLSVTAEEEVKKTQTDPLSEAVSSVSPASTEASSSVKPEATVEEVVKKTQTDLLSATAEEVVKKTQTDLLSATAEEVVRKTQTDPLSATAEEVVKKTQTDPLSATAEEVVKKTQTDLLSATAEEVVRKTQTDLLSATAEEVVRKTQTDLLSATAEEVVRKTQTDPLSATAEEVVKKTQTDLLSATAEEVVRKTQTDPLSATAEEVVKKTQTDPLSATAEEVVKKTQTDPLSATAEEVVKKTQTDPLSVTAEEVVKKTQTDPLSATAEEVVRKPPAGLDSCLTAGERIGSLLCPQNIRRLGHNIILSPKPFSLQSRLLLITDLPPYEDGCYTESSIGDLLLKFGFQYEDKNIYVIPQARMAFALMPSYEKAKEVFLAAKQGLILNGSKWIGVEIISSGILMTPFGFYKSLMETINIPVTDDGTSTIYIQNISPSEARDLRETLRVIGSVKNYLLLLNKVFIEFESAPDADRIGVWYSLFKRRFAHKVYRIKLPITNIKSLPPRLAAKALPDSKDVAVGPVVPPTNIDVPEGSTAPFSVTMTAPPFIFPTVSPWFIIPKYRTVNKEEDLLASVSVASKFSTVMVTGLPLGTYKHEDVARLVWKYFPEQNLQTLLYNIVVLPLQRRAFVYFADWQSCHSFVKDFLKKQVSIKGRMLHIHLVLEEMLPGSSEEMMYQTLMKWSNVHVPELESLQDRLVCLELSEISVNLFMTILGFVTSCCPIVGFLPLASRLCIEMAESRGVDQVVGSFANTPEGWNKVRSVESVKSLKRRIKDSSEIKIHLELDSEDINVKTPATKGGSLPPPLPGVSVKSDAQPAVQEVATLPNSVLVTENLATNGSVTQDEKMEIAAETQHVQPKVERPISEKQPDVRGKVQESAVVPGDETGTGRETAPEKRQQAETVDVEVKEVEAGSCAESKGGETADVKPTESLTATTTVKTQPSKPSASPHQSPQTNLKTQQTSLVQNDTQANPNLKTKTNMSGHSGLVKTHKNPASNVSAASAQFGPNTKPSATERPTAAAASSTDASSLTPGEKMQDFLTPSNLHHLNLKTVLSPRIFSLNVTLAITDLPQFYDGCYTEADLVDLLQRYGVQCEIDKLFVVPQSRMAFLILPNVTEVQSFFKVLSWRNIIFKESKLSFQVISSCIPMTLFGFYKFLMSFTKSPVKQNNCDTRSIVYFRNISASEARYLREALRKIGSVRNYLPLLNKVFVHCETPLDADRLQVWYTSWKWRLFNHIQQKNLPEILNSSPPPSLAAPVLLLKEDIAVGTSAPKTGDKDAPLPTPAVSGETFWCTMTTSPYVFHTASPCFNIPAHQTVNRKTYMEISQRHVKFPTIMLTGLPNKSFTHEDVAMLVWNYFPEQNLHTLYNNIVVLPLQRRAFVFFSSSDACLRFLQNRNMNLVYLKGFIPKIHLVLEDIDLGSSEESMFRTLMKWSNIYVPDLTSLEERLLCVEVSGLNEQIVMMVMKEVASIATFVSFLPLANMIYIEMAESTGASKVVQNLSVCKLSEQHKAWKQVGRVEGLTSRKKRLKDCRKIAVNLERGTISVSTEATPLKSPSKSPPLLCRRREEESASCNALPDGSLLPSDKGTEYPQIDLGFFKTLKEVILQHKHEQRRSSLMKKISIESSSNSESPFPSKQTNEEMQSSCLSSATRDISQSTKDCKSSASSSRSTKSSLSSSSSSLLVNTKKLTPESTKSETNPSSSADGSKTFPSSSSSKSGKSSTSSGEKDQSNKTETSLTASQTPSTSTSRNACSSSTSAETPQSDKNKAKLTGAAVANTDHQVSAESCTAKTQSDSKLETSSEVSPAARGQNLKFSNQIQNKEGSETNEKEREGDDNVKSAVEEGPDHENYQITDSVAGQKDQQNCDNETPGPEKSQTLCQEGLEVSDNVEDGKKALDKMEMEAFPDAKDNPTEKQSVVVKDGNRLDKDESSIVKPDQRTKASRGEEGETLPIKQESSDKHSETKTTDSSEEIGTGERTEGMVCKDSPTQRSVGRSNRGAKQDKINQDKVATDEPTITTRFAMGRRKIPEKHSSDKRKDNAPRRRRNTPVRDSQEQNKEETLKREEELPAEDVTPTTCEQKPPQEVSDNVNFKEAKEEDKEAVTTRKRGRPRKTAGLAPVMKSTRGMKEETSRDNVKGRRTRSSSAALERSVEPKPTECAGVNSGRKVTKERRSAKTAPVLDSPERGQELDVSKAETSKSSLKKGVQVSHGINNEVQMCRQPGDDADVKEKEIVTDDREASAQEEKLLVKDEGLAVKPSQETRASKSKEGENSAKKQERSDKQPETQTKDSSAETDEGTVEMVCKDSVKNKSGKERAFRQTTRLAKQDETNEDKVATNAPTVATRSTSRRRKIAEKDSSVKRKEDKRSNSKTRRKTNAGDSQQQNKGKTQKTDEETIPKDITPMTCEQKPSQEISEDVNCRKNGEEGEKAATTRKRGRPKKTAGPAPVRKSARGVKTEYPDGQMLRRLRNKRKMEFSGPEPKRSRSQFARVVRRPPCKPHRKTSGRSNMKP